MIKVESILRAVDNSGAIFCGCIQVLTVSKRIGAFPGQTITITVKKNIFKSHITKKSKVINKSQICKALIIRSVRGVKRWGNFFIRGNTNSVVLLNNYNLPYGTRIFGPVFLEVKKRILYTKIISLADIVV